LSNCGYGSQMVYVLPAVPPEPPPDDEHAAAVLTATSAASAAATARLLVANDLTAPPSCRLVPSRSQLAGQLTKTSNRFAESIR
jgi:hypothetical protein